MGLGLKHKVDKIKVIQEAVVLIGLRTEKPQLPYTKKKITVRINHNSSLIEPNQVWTPIKKPSIIKSMTYSIKIPVLQRPGCTNVCET